MLAPNTGSTRARRWIGFVKVLAALDAQVDRGQRHIMSEGGARLSAQAD